VQDPSTSWVSTPTHMQRHCWEVMRPRCRWQAAAIHAFSHLSHARFSCGFALTTQRLCSLPMYNRSSVLRHCSQMDASVLARSHCQSHVDMRSCHGSHQVNSRADVIVLCTYLVPSIVNGISMISHLQHSLKRCIISSTSELSPARWLTLRPQRTAASRRHDQRQVRHCQSLQMAASQPPTAACGQPAADMAVPQALDAPVARLCTIAVPWEEHQVTAEALIEALRMRCFANGYCTKAAPFQARLMV
jgi:hypothetical protein